MPEQDQPTRPGNIRELAVSNSFSERPLEALGSRMAGPQETFGDLDARSAPEIGQVDNMPSKDEHRGGTDMDANSADPAALAYPADPLYLTAWAEPMEPASPAYAPEHTAGAAYPSVGEYPSGPYFPTPERGVDPNTPPA